MVEDVKVLQNSIENINFGGNSKTPYVGKLNALILFRRDYPGNRGRIVTTMLSMEPIVFKAEVWVDDMLIATAHANPDGKTNTFRKVEGAAIRRALETAGYSAKQIMWRIADEIGVDEAKKLLGSGGADTERRMGDKPAEPKNKPAAPKQPTPPAQPRNSTTKGSPFTSHVVKTSAPKYGKPDPRYYIKVLPKDLDTGDVIDPEGNDLQKIITSVEIRTGEVIVTAESPGLKEKKYTFDSSLSLVEVISGPKVDAFKLDSSVAPIRGGHPVWQGEKPAA